MYLVCATKSGRLVVVWRVDNTAAATQEIKSETHDGPARANKRSTFGSPMLIN